MQKMGAVKTNGAEPGIPSPAPCACFAERRANSSQGVAGATVETLFSDRRRSSGPYQRLRKFLLIEFAAFVLVKPVKLSPHEVHEFLFGNLAVLIGVHEQHQLLYLCLAKRQRALLLGHGLVDLLCGHAGDSQGQGGRCNTRDD